MSSKNKKEKSVEKVVEKTVEKSAEKEKNVEKVVDQADYNKFAKDTRAVPIAEWDWSRVVYCQPQKSELPDGTGHYRRVRILYKYDDHTVGPAIAGVLILILGIGQCFVINAISYIAVLIALFMMKEKEMMKEKSMMKPKEMKKKK